MPGGHSRCNVVTAETMRSLETRWWQQTQGIDSEDKEVTAEMRWWQQTQGGDSRGQRTQDDDSRGLDTRR